jgi:ADP-ribose pyrophosphatase
MIHPWEKVQSEVQGEYKVFRVREDRCRSPLTGAEHPFYVIESDDWVNIIPVTPDGRIVCVEQYRHGVEAVSLEIPGGIIDPEDASPAEAARREMVEETGYDTDTIVALGSVSPNPAIQNNRCYSYLALDVHLRHAQELDATEHVAVRLVDPADVPGLIARGEISHALVVGAFYFFEQYRKAHPAPK